MPILPRRETLYFIRNPGPPPTLFFLVTCEKLFESFILSPLNIVFKQNEPTKNVRCGIELTIVYDRGDYAIICQMSSFGVNEDFKALLHLSDERCHCLELILRSKI